MKIPLSVIDVSDQAKIESNLNALVDGKFDPCPSFAEGPATFRFNVSQRIARVTLVAAKDEKGTEPSNHNHLSCSYDVFKLADAMKFATWTLDVTAGGKVVGRQGGGDLGRNDLFSRLEWLVNTTGDAITLSFKSNKQLQLCEIFIYVYLGKQLI